MIVACWKWIAAGDDRWPRTSAADQAALEIALRLATASGDEVTVVSVGRAQAEPALREALAAGATRAVRIDAPDGLTGSAVAAAIAGIAGDVQWALCGDASADRGTGSVPAFLAAELGTAQALGLVDVEPQGGDRLRAVRRLDGGRREVLTVGPPAVLSVEGSVARLRRASLAAELAARRAAINVFAGPPGPIEPVDAVHPYRPRARERTVPFGTSLERVRQLTTSAAVQFSAPAGPVVLDPPAAAARILDALREWGYVD